MLPTNTDRGWKQWGQQDPYYAVYSKPEYRKQNLTGSRDEFFRAGEQHVTQALSQIENRFKPFARKSALDFGCGVGRILMPLSKEFEHVDGVDISPNMLEEASSNCNERRINNVELLQSDDQLTALKGRMYDFVHTYVVLQHITPVRGYALIDEMLSKVNPEGAFYIHVNVKRMLSPIRRAVYNIKHKVPFAYMGFNVLQRRPLKEIPMQMNEYDFSILSMIFAAHGFESVGVAIEKHPSPLGIFLTAGFFGKRYELQKSHL